MSQRFFTYDERPELRDRCGFLSEAWPAFMLESPVSNECWHLLYERFGGFHAPWGSLGAFSREGGSRTVRGARSVDVRAVPGPDGAAVGREAELGAALRARRIVAPEAVEHPALCLPAETFTRALHRQQAMVLLGPVPASTPQRPPEV